ncbi:BcPKS20, polyketide synthase [Aspergillus steynii IBT 23096]|uniref:BcPKS20, polyketide synthase n=1 Tax=Aspergillus steynii IBT 23096 TaxID=1392250 RepID=A0A2I2G8X8_9EURO|nr:BcPKS20, polyketide synthase [Aspergillus steynii IBT 23096]PLB49342.1 BcPKS20, polyketide synthase [Aspergillus steynii IBT 23096]
MTSDLFHRLHWTPATLAQEPLNFTKVVFVVDSPRTQESQSTRLLAAYQAELVSWGYATAVINNPLEIHDILTPGTATIIVHIPHVAHGCEGVYDAAIDSCASLIAIAQELVSRPGTTTKLFSIVADDDGISELGHAPLTGLARVLRMEIPDLFGGLLQLGTPSWGFPLSAIKYAQGFDVIRVCDEGEESVPQTASLQPLVLNGEGENELSSQLNSNSTYLITGGTKGIGLEIASWMVAHGARHLILVSRHGLEVSGAGGAASNHLVARIADMEAQGASVHVLAIDLGLPGAADTLRKAIDSLQQPDVKGVVHAAGTAGYHTLNACTPTDIQNVFASKVRGALSLDALFPPRTLDFFLLMSSVGQLVGFPGQLSYAPANAFLDGLATWRRREGDNTTSVQWTSWRGVGMVAQSRSVTRMVNQGNKERGLGDMPKEEALEALEHILALQTDNVAVVRALEVEADEPPRHPILKHITPRRKQKEYRDYPKHAVAVVAMACQTAAGETLDELWELLQSGQSTVREIDAVRFADAAGSPNRLWGNFLPDIERFDEKFFGKSRREAAAMDPHQRLMLQITYHAVEAAGWVGGEGMSPETHDPATSGHITGCFIGMNAPDYVVNLGSQPPSPYTGGGMMRSFVAGRLSHYFGWTGPSHTIDTACSSAMVAIHQACRAIQVGECTRAIAGGVNLIPNTALFDALRAGGFLSETGACKTFDARADGYCRGEAVGVVVLKPLETAVRDGDDIQGVLLSTGNNQNISNTSITNPVLESQSALYRDVLARAGVHPHDVSYVEAHGTGTRAGDPVEVQGIRQVLGGPDRRSILHIGAVKPNIGHSEAASGVISLIKVLLMLKHGKIPPQAHFRSLNPNIAALEPDRMAIPTSLRNWSSGERLAVVNSYGASGSNAAAVVGPPAARPYSTRPIRDAEFESWPIFLSAASKPSLLAYCTNLQQYVGNERNDFSLAQLAFALTAKVNRQLSVTFCTTAKSPVDDLHAQLGSPESHISRSEARPTVLLISGQNGSKTPAVKSLYDSSLLFRTRLQQCEETMLTLGLPSVVSSVLNGNGDADGHEDLVLRHAALFSIQYACGMAWIDSGVTPQAICGHSFGEWAALTISGALTLESGIKLVTGRAAIIEKLWGPDTGSMVAIEADLVSTNMTPVQHLQLLLEKHPNSQVEIACYNGPNNYVVAGSTQEIELLATYLQDQKSNVRSHGNRLRCKVLQGMHAYHSHMADPIVKACAELSASIPFQRPTLPFVSCHRSDDEDWERTSETAAIIPRNTRGPVHFGDAVQRIVTRLGPSCTFLEAGVGGPITAMAQSALAPAEHTFVAINGTHPRRSLAAATAALWKRDRAVQFWLFHRSQSVDYGTPHGTSLDLPPYQFEKHRHWTEYKKTRHLEANGRAEHTEQLCQNCQKNVADYPYIVCEGSPSQLSSGSKFTFHIHTRSQRYQQLVSGHVVVGNPLCPAGMYLEFAAHAVLMLRGGIEDGAQIVIGSLEIKAPLGLDTTRSVKCTLSQKQPETWRFDIFSIHGDPNDDRPISHGTGIIQCGKVRIDEEVSAAHKWPRISNLLENDPDTEALRGGMVYKVFASMAKYSAPYRGLRYLVGKGSEGAGEIEMPRAQLGLVAQAPNESVTDALLVDNFMQVAGIFVHSLRGADPEEADKTDATSYICTGMGIVRPLNGSPGSGGYRAYTKVVRDDGRVVVLDLFAFDRMSQQMIWSAQGLRFTRVPRSSLVKALTGANAVLLEDTPQRPSEQEIKHSVPEKPTPPRGDAILSGVQDVLSKCLDVPVADVKKESLLEELGTDSLVSPEILVGIAGRFDVDLSTSDLAAALDVASLCDIISSRLEAGCPADNASRPQDLERTEDSQNIVIRILSDALGLDPAEIDLGSRLEDLGSDSLIAPEIISSLKKALGVEISSVDFASVPDVISLCHLVGGSPARISSNSLSLSSSASNPDTPASDMSQEGSSNPGSMHAAFLQVRQNFDAHAGATGFAGYWKHVYPDQLRTVTTFIVEAFEKLGCPIRNFESGQALPAVQGTLPKYQREVTRLWQILAEGGIVTIQRHSKNPVYIRGVASLEKDHDSEEQSTRLCSDFPSYSAAHGLLALLGPHLAEYLTGKRDPIPPLFASDHGRRLLDGFYGHGPDIRAATQLLCDFLSAAIHSAGGEPFNVLEIGAGTGGTTKHLVPLLQATGLPFTYTFTDLSVSLVARAKKADFKGVPEMEFLKLNVEEEPPQELQGRYHAVVSSNCVHATRDIRQSLRNIHKLVRPHDGCVVLLELIQQLPWYDLVWGLLDGWWLFDDDRQYPLLTPWAWERTMRDSGFAHVDWSEGSSRESRTLRIIAGFAAHDEQQPCPAKATSMLLYRGPSSRSLFLAPDGAGYGTVFNPLGQLLARISPSMTVYALNSPFITAQPAPGHLPSVQGMAASYTAEIKRRQPKGPYLLGGYSFGGIVAYEAVRQLLEAGDEVEKLILLDVPCPTSSACMSDALVRYVSAITSPGDISLARKQLEQYQVTKLPGLNWPQTVLVSARDGVDGTHDNQEDRGFSVLPEHRRVTDWLLNGRTDDGPLGWEELMGPGNVKVIRADGHHYSMVLSSTKMDEWVLPLVELLDG